VKRTTVRTGVFACLSTLLAIAPIAAPLAAADTITLSVSTDEQGKAISPDLMGVFFEDLNHAGDGGLYPELIQNRSFEYRATEQPTWNNLSFWTLTPLGGAKGSMGVEQAWPVHANNPNYAVLEVQQPAGEGVAMSNAGYEGIALRAGEQYELSFFTRQLYFGKRWGAREEGTLPLVVRLETPSGEVLAHGSFDIAQREWQRSSVTLTPSRTETSARLVLLAKMPGGIALDEVSLFPKKTFRERPNGLRPDLAQVIADLKPRFIRFPGGCLVHGNGLGNMYRWKDTIGPIEQRRQQANLWGYHQTSGLGYFEYFQFAEDIGAKPVPVVPAGVCCQNSDHQGGTGQRGLPLESMQDYIQEVLDLIEYANGPVTSKWGALRAAAGHPEPFNLQYLGVGNEDHITFLFKKRFEMIYQAVKAKHPQITVIGTTGPFHSGDDYDQGWKIANELAVPMVDEHYYVAPQWFWDNLQRYDSYDRSNSQVYLGEYAAHDEGRRTTLRAALAEAAYLTSLERNGDLVRMASYAPLLGRERFTNWNPNLIYFNATEVFPTIGYEVQRLFGHNSGDRYLTTSLAGIADAERVAASTVRDSATGDLILKIVNGGATSKTMQIELRGAPRLPRRADVTVLAGEADAVNDYAKKTLLKPKKSTIGVARSFSYAMPGNSFSVIRIKGAGR
jgi:alpha-L-arabinofuranosidase